MLGVMMYFLDDYLSYREKNRQLWWDMGYRKHLGDRVRDAIDRVRARRWERRYVRWR